MYKGRGRGEGRNRIGKNQSMSGRNGARWKFFSGWANFVQFEIEFWRSSESDSGGFQLARNRFTWLIAKEYFLLVTICFLENAGVSWFPYSILVTLIVVSFDKEFNTIIAQNVGQASSSIGSDCQQFSHFIEKIVQGFVDRTRAVSAIDAIIEINHTFI